MDIVENLRTQTRQTQQRQQYQTQLLLPQSPTQIQWSPYQYQNQYPYQTQRVLDRDGGAVSSNPTIVYVIVKHNPNIIGTIGGNTPGTAIIQS
jgi:hypothetical protein